MNAKQLPHFNRRLLVWLTFLALALNHLPLADAQTFISTGAVWKFLDNGQDQGTAWRAVNFDDSTWASGPAQLGFGDGDEATIAGAATRPVTVYFRHQFNVAQVLAGGSLTLRLLRDDGAVVYVNGTEVFRSNLPDGPVTYNTFATVAVGGPEETSAFVSATLHPAVLVPGVNVVAVEVHQVNVTSSDLSFDLEFSQDFAGTNQPIVTVMATDAAAAEARTFVDEFPNPGVFRFLRAGPTNDALTVGYRLSGTASNGVDYAALPGFVLISAGAPFADLEVSVRDDGAVEGTETVHLTLAPSPCIDVFVPGCYSIGTGSVATVTILDNDPPPSERTVINVVASDPQAAETGPLAVVNPGTFTFFRTGNLDTPVTVLFTLSGTASNGVDYIRLTNRVAFAAGATEARLNVSPINDAFIEGTETVAVTLEPPVCIAVIPPPPECYVVGPSNRATVFIADSPTPTNQPPTVRLNHPQDGQVFAAPANIHLQAYAQDSEDGFNLQVEFFEGARSLGFGTFVPSLCPSPYCPYFSLTWSNVPPGNYTLTARVTDQAGASDMSAQVLVTVRAATNAPPGTKLWEFSTGSVYASPAVAADGTVYIVAGNPDSILYALRPSGVPKWETLLGRSGSSPAIGVDGTIYVGANRTFRAYNPDGILLWSFSFPATTLFYYVSAPAIAMDGTIYVGTGAPDKGLYAFRRDGTLKWKFIAGGAYADVYAPVIGTDGTIYFGTYNDRFYAVNPDGTKRWDFPMAGYNVSAAVGGDGTIYVVGSLFPNKLYAFTPGGVKKWERQIGPQLSQASSAPAIGPDGTIHVGCGHDLKLYAFNPDGSDKWTFATGGNVGGTSASPAVDAAGNVYTSFGVSFFAISSSGSRLWSFQHNGVFTAPSLTEDGIIYVGSAADRVYAFQANAGLAQSPWPMFQRNLRHAGAAPLVLVTNHPPTVAIVVPTNGAVYHAPTDIPIQAVTQDPDGYADTVEFFANGVKIGEAHVVFIQPPPPGEPIHFEFNWTNAPVGEHRLSARTRDDRGATGVSAPVNIEIRSSPPGDSDDDGVVDSHDRCPVTPPGVAVNSDGCSIAQLCLCGGSWRNHADYVGCVIEQAWRFYRQGLITVSDRRLIIGEAARSNCGRHEGAHLHLQPQTREEIQQGGRCLIVCGETSSICVLECSTDLLNWTTIQTITLPSAEMEVVDTVASQATVRFYRIRLAP